MRKAIVPCSFCSKLNSIDLSRLADRPKCGACSRSIQLDYPMRLNDENFGTVANGAQVPLLVDFYADWCMPCKMMAPFIDELAHERRGEILVGKIDVDHAPNAAGRYAVRAVPTLIVFENGAEKARQAGAMRREQIESLIGFGADRFRA